MEIRMMRPIILSEVRKRLKKKNIRLNDTDKYKKVSDRACCTCLICNYGSIGEWTPYLNKLINLSTYQCPRCYNNKRSLSKEDFKTAVKKYMGSEYKFTGNIRISKYDTKVDGKVRCIKTKQGEISHIVCGNTAYKPMGDIKRSPKCEKCSFGKRSPHFQGYGDIPGRFISVLKDSAASRDLKYNLIDKYLWDLFLKQDKKCALSGMNIYFGNACNKNSERYIEVTASLDRIDSSKGYITGNVQWVHKYVNFMKSNFSQLEFIEMCIKIAKHNR